MMTAAYRQQTTRALRVSIHVISLLVTTKLLSACGVMPQTAYVRPLPFITSGNTTYTLPESVRLVPINTASMRPATRTKASNTAASHLPTNTATKPYRVNAGDEPSITVWNFPAFERSARVSASGEDNNAAAPVGTQVKHDGTIFLPYVGNIDCLLYTSPSPRD